MTLKNVLEEICAEEYALPANTPRHCFSLRHRRAMNKILYPDNLPKTEKKLKIKRRVILIAAIVVLAVITGAASIIRYGGFRFVKTPCEKYNRFVVFAENANKAPQTIENLCYECNVPEKFQRIDRMCQISEDDVKEVYSDLNAVVPENYSKPFVWVYQITKSSFSTIIYTEFDEFTPIKVKGHNGFSVATSGDLENGCKFVLNAVMWNCGEYIHMVYGTVSMEELWKFVDGLTEI